MLQLEAFPLLQTIVNDCYNEDCPDEKYLKQQQEGFECIKKKVVELNERIASFESWQVHKYGSSSMGIASIDSDLDVGIQISARAQIQISHDNKTSLLEDLSFLLDSIEGTSHESKVVGKNYPTLKIENFYGFDYDISICDNYTISRNEQISCLINEYSRHIPIKQFIKFIKKFTKKNLINGTYSGYLSSFSYTIMALICVDEYGWIETADHDLPTIGRMLYSFFVLYGYTFNGDKKMISLSSPHFIKKKSNNDAVIILDPCKPNENIAKFTNYQKRKQIQETFKNAAKIIMNWNGKQTAYLYHKLMDIKLPSEYDDDLFFYPKVMRKHYFTKYHHPPRYYK